MKMPVLILSDASFLHNKLMNKILMCNYEEKAENKERIRTG